ncbi:putative transcription factor C2H2 family [Medicago truncatula]|uniref:Putative transcription factor C2H2 family n=1 Tax=Medicago truncatula TaxID=3880 RepID=A0A072V8C4_MEDTR|nr:probable E3 ubiquitin-protein ligase RHY1A [Medicago truncatula]KEH38087.1 zinc finger, C3HC4 type (RING finger) protein [Medicago truncatula]RHN74030.1 putative transcription factor C2H2 family [Medicago truncatula]
MAGMLPGVESARRRRVHKCGGFSDSPSFSSHNTSRRSSFCLYASNHESRISSSSSMQRNILYQSHQDENMVGAARAAKQRLDDKFRSQRVSENIRKKNMKCVEGRKESIEELQSEVYGTKKSGPRKFSWSKLSWKASEQEDCAVCLESFKIGDKLIPLPCAHKFHSTCLKPWLENNSHCPCCRTTILSL